MRRACLALLAALPLAACGDGDRIQQERAERSAPPSVLVQDRYVVRQSSRDFEGTLSALFEALDRRELTVFAVIDHAAAAQSVGAQLAPTTVVVFGNPEAGTPLMTAVPILGAELPLRALVYERGGEVFVAMTGAANLGRTYPLSDQAELLAKIERTVGEIGAEVTQP